MNHIPFDMLHGKFQLVGHLDFGHRVSCVVDFQHLEFGVPNLVSPSRCVLRAHFLGPVLQLLASDNFLVSIPELPEHRLRHHLLERHVSEAPGGLDLLFLLKRRRVEMEQYGIAPRAEPEDHRCVLLQQLDFLW